MEQPLVTVITPVYNCEKFIEQTMASVLVQVYGNLEYIVIDDGSTDGSWERIKKVKYLKGDKDYRLLDDRLHIETYTNNGEQSTVNKLLMMVTGKYFMIVNADDPLKPGAIRKLVDFMEVHPEVLCAYPDWEALNEDGSHRWTRYSREYVFIYMVKHHTCLPSVGSIFRSSILEMVGYRDTSFKWLGDFDFWLRIGLAGKMARVPEVLATWRNRNGQASKDKSDARAQEHIRIIRKFYCLPTVSHELWMVKPEAVCWSYLVAATVTDSKVKALGYIYRAWRSYPTVVFSVEFWDTVRSRLIYFVRR